MITAIKSSDMLIEGVLDHGLTFIGDYLERILHHSVLIADHHGRIYFPEKKSPALIDSMFVNIPPSVSDYENVLAASNIATRILGFVNAPSLFQRVIARCLEAKVDIDTYNRNRELLYQSLLSFGYECIKPQGAFYLFVKTPIEDDLEFCQRAKQKKILLVPGTSFGCPGYVRIAYCVAYQTIEKALPGFKELINECK
jgi:aspartate aminotransferase